MVVCSGKLELTVTERKANENILGMVTIIVLRAYRVLWHICLIKHTCAI